MTLLTAGLGLLPAYGQTNEPIRSAERRFNIPFQIQSPSDDPIRNVELLFSRDGGRSWHVYGRATSEETMIGFVAPTDGEYWFAFRTYAASGKVRPQGLPTSPQMRVIVGQHLAGSLAAPPMAATIPPKPIRSAVKKKEQPTQHENDSELSESLPVLEEKMTEKLSVPALPRRLSTLPRQPVAETKPASPEEQQPAPPLPTFESLIQDINPLFTAKEPPATRETEAIAEVTPPETSLEPMLIFEPAKTALPTPSPQDASDSVAVSAVPAQVAPPIASSVQPPASVKIEVPSASTPQKTPPAPGRITKIDLQTDGEKAKIVVQWAVSGHSNASAMRADILRGVTYEGPWVPIVNDLQNTGEYWWQISSTDFTPFFIAIRLHAPDGRFGFDVTRSPIKIDPTMLSP